MGSQFHNWVDSNGVTFFYKATRIVSHFHNWTDYNGVTFLVELLEWGRIFTTGLTLMGLLF